ncbi:hypothetical protein E5Q_03127 [Mixia osmundae IAM 14324]|uniref:Fringe-like glycosyltransferase domain-containing protein n=2 Tax=Mixia osmundae (strain CBS 9802 / IAM 14324 / JCM 22182 / KY 12970) TaxID=764103 RepID=G7E0V0_MIXOS|nr:hypothetical protein E5Q_03127 [Mixia osmundae IAM 14324]
MARRSSASLHTRRRSSIRRSLEGCRTYEDELLSESGNMVRLPHSPLLLSVTSEEPIRSPEKPSPICIQADEEKQFLLQARSASEDWYDESAPKTVHWIRKYERRLAVAALFMLVLAAGLVALVVIVVTQARAPRYTRDLSYEVEINADYSAHLEDYLEPASRDVTWLNDTIASTGIHSLPMISSRRFPADTPAPSDIAFAFSARFDSTDDWLPNWHTLLAANPGSSCTILIRGISKSEPGTNIPDVSQEQIDDFLTQVNENRVDCKITYTTHRDARKDYAMVPLVAQEYHRNLTGRSPNYVIMADDDTLFVDMRDYRRMLSNYDPSLPYFIGSMSDTKKRREEEGSFAYGGASMILTAAMLDAMQSTHADCLDKLSQDEYGGGDVFLELCASQAEGIKPYKGSHQVEDMAGLFTFQIGLHQCDYTGNGDGFFQSGRRFLTLHHFLSKTYIKPFPKFISRRTAMQNIVLAAQRLGGQNLFKRHVFDQGRQLWVPGHSITRYSRAIPRTDLASMEATVNEVRFVGPTRPAIAEGLDEAAEDNTKETFYLSLASIVAPSSTLLEYTARDNSTITVLIHHEA